VDDEPAVTGYLTEMLIAAGYRVTAFTDPVHALERFRSGPDEVDLVVTDQTMPHMSGAGLAEVLLDTRPDLPVILCTGFSERIDEQGAQRLGIRHFFRKPVAAEVLLMALAQELIH
jgi:CheY-like chemotaxis protein